ncbi:MAG: ExbD/TolR family protein [Flavobacteriales bacterium]
MAEMAESGGGHKEGKKRAKKSSTRVDMTPMVDLAFLLLTFFVLTSTFSKPRIMRLAYPAKNEDKESEAPKVKNGITFLLSKDKIFYYTGEFFSTTKPGPSGPTALKATDFSANGVRKLLAELNMYVLQKKQGLEKKVQMKQLADTTFLRLMDEAKVQSDALKVLVKTDDKATCKNFVDLIDELKIAEIGVIAPVEMMPEELELLKQNIK